MTRPKSVYRDMVIGHDKIRYLHWWNRWYWRHIRKAQTVPEWDGVERYIMPRIYPDTVRVVTKRDAL